MPLLLPAETVDGPGKDIDWRSRTQADSAARNHTVVPTGFLA